MITADSEKSFLDLLEGRASLDLCCGISIDVGACSMGLWLSICDLELLEMDVEAMKHDGRPVQHPAKSQRKESQIMNLLLAQFESLINQ